MPIRWNANGSPYSIEFNDKYFCTENGYEECNFVSCQGNRLQDRFSKLDPTITGTFTIIETGFGTGLSFCCAWKVWKDIAPPSWQLHFISIELYPVKSTDIGQALAQWPQLSYYKDLLMATYKVNPGGMEEMIFDQDRVRLTIVYEDVVKALKTIKDKALAPQGAEAWFLNGFAPFNNPLMWTPDVFEGMRPLSHAGTTLATFTVAGVIRRGLEDKGFQVQRVPGFGKKKHILTGVYRG